MGDRDDWERCDYCGDTAECGATCHGTRACSLCWREGDAAEDYEDEEGDHD